MLTNALPLFVFAALCFTLLAWFRFRWALAVILLLLPSYQLRVVIAGVPTTFLEMLLLVLALVWGVQRYLHGGRSFALLPWRWFMLILLLVGVVSALVSPDPRAGLGLLRAYAVEPIFFFVVLWDRLEHPRDVRLLVGAAALSVLSVAVVAGLQYAGVLPSLLPWSAETPRRVVGLFAYPNAVGLFLAPMLGLLSALLVFRESGYGPAMRGFLLFTILAGFAALVFSVSRGALIGAAVAVAFVAFTSRFRRWAMVGCLLLVLLAWSLPASRTAVQNVLSGEDVSTDVRTVLWQGTIRMLADRPLLGAGLGGFPVRYDEYRLAKHTELLQYPHNIVLNVWTELGLAGLFLFVWLSIDVLGRGTRLIRRQPPSFSRALAVGVLAAGTAMLVHGLVDVPYFKNDLAVQFWLLMALLAFADRTHLSERKVGQMLA